MTLSRNVGFWRDCAGSGCAFIGCFSNTFATWQSLGASQRCRARQFTGPYQQDIAAAFRRAQEGALAGGGDYGDRVHTIEQLWEDPDWPEAIFTGGTGSVLDFFEFAVGKGPAGSDRQDAAAHRR